MNHRKRNRIFTILIMLSLCSIGVYIILSNLNDNIVFFYPPSEISKIKKNSKVRVGGIVKNGSITREINNKIRFIITDYSEELEIIYQGILPALFREGQGIVAEGTLQPTRSFLAKKLLAKHDENYMPPQIKQHIDSVKH
ncbi:MAG: cytochrome c maturation protein CcmE [Rickettsiaceae bacterium]|nr:cytochrome c maturation protein CcmE [Rickettsiaceae bacterium]